MDEEIRFALQSQRDDIVSLLRGYNSNPSLHPKTQEVLFILIKHLEIKDSKFIDARNGIRATALDEAAATQCKDCRDRVPIVLRDITDELEDEGQILFWQHKVEGEGGRVTWNDCEAHAIQKLKHG